MMTRIFWAAIIGMPERRPAEVGDVGFKLRRALSSYWRDVAWQSSGSSLAQLVGVAGIPVLTRLYKPEDFAVQSLFLQVVTFATALVTWRFEYFVQLPKLQDDVCAMNRLVLVLGLLATLILTPFLWVYGDVLAQQLGNRALESWLFLAPITAVLVSWAVALQNNAQRLVDFKTSGLSELVGKLAYVLAGIVGVLGRGAAGLIITTAMAAIGKLVFIFIRRSAWSEEILRADTNIDALRRVGARYGRLATLTVLSHFMTASTIAVPQIAMAHLYGTDVLGQFALVLATIYLPSGLLGSAIGQVYYQRAAQRWADSLPFFDLWRNTSHKLLMIGIPVYGMAALLSEFAYPVIFGGEWSQAGEFATLMAVAAFASFVSTPMDRTCLVIGAGLYLFLLSAYRMTSTAVVIWLAWVKDFTPLNFIMALTIQMCVAYGIDLWMSCRFSRGQLGLFARN